MPSLTKEDILKRGWAEETFNSLAGNSQVINKQKQEFWHLNYIEKIAI